MSLPRAEPTCRCAEKGGSSMARSPLKPAQVAQYLGRKNSNRIAQVRVPSTLPPDTHGIWSMYSSLQRLRSLRYDTALVCRFPLAQQGSAANVRTQAPALCTQ